MIHRTTLILAGITIALVLYGALFAPPKHPAFPWHDLPGHMALIGFVGCLALTAFAKALGKVLVQRPEERDEH